MKKITRSDVVENRGTWGKFGTTLRAPSGVKIKMTADADMVLKFLGNKDITDLLREDQKRPGHQALIHQFWDGKQNVAFSAVHASSDGLQKPMESGKWYYIHNAGFVDTGNGLQPMADLEIVEIAGADGEEIDCIFRVHPSGKIKLADAAIAEANYTRLNYPLRTA